MAAAAGVQQHMQSLEGMFDTQLAAVVEERDALRECVREEQDKVRGGLDCGCSTVAREC